MDWDDAFNNMGHVTGSEALPGLWSKAAAQYRSAVTVETDISYGHGARHVFDLVLPDGAPKGLVVFVHGGFWMRLSKDYWTHYAEGARAQGWAVAIPSYTLAPEARLSDMTQEIAAAITGAAERVSGPVCLVGHSAGGHLVTRQISTSSPLPEAMIACIDHTVSISGLHDLRPLLLTKMNQTLRIDETEARAESVVLLRPKAKARVTAWVGGGERPEFIRQSKLLEMMWRGLDAKPMLTVEDSHNHFTVLEALRRPDSPLTHRIIA
jgi:hypothetical protein